MKYLLIVLGQCVPSTTCTPVNREADLGLALDREEKSRNTEKQIKFLVYTLELASKLADTSGREHGAHWQLLGSSCY